MSVPKQRIFLLDKTHSVIYTGGTLKSMVTVAQSAELWIVAPAVVGSSPIGHPTQKSSPSKKVVPKKPLVPTFPTSRVNI
jgi:hypothetical protein